MDIKQTVSNKRIYTPKHQRRINQKQNITESTSDLPGFENNENSELKVSYIVRDSTNEDSENKTTLTTNMIKLEN